MIFCKFISGTKLDHDESDQVAEAAAYASSMGESLEGASGSSAVSRLRRLMQVSSGMLVGKQQVSKILRSQGGSGEGEDKKVESASSTDKKVEGKKAEEQKDVGEVVFEKHPDWQLECKYTLSEVQQHSSLDDCWMVIFDKVYNITDFVYEHPGGDFILLEYAGRDATHPFLSSRHGSSAYKMLDKYWIGILVDEELYYSNNSSYCSVYSNLSWRSTPTLEDDGPRASASIMKGQTTPDSSTLKATNRADSCSSLVVSDQDEDSSLEEETSEPSKASRTFTASDNSHDTCQSESQLTTCQDTTSCTSTTTPPASDGQTNSAPTSLDRPQQPSADETQCRSCWAEAPHPNR